MKSEDMEEVAVCTECLSDQNPNKVIKNPFFQQGGRIPCHYCGGLVVITSKSNRDNVVRKLDSRD